MILYKRKLRNFCIGFAGLLIFICIDDSMNMMMLLPITFLLMIFKTNNKGDRKLMKDVVILSLLSTISLLLATIFNSESITIMSIVRLLYTCSIYVFVYLICSEDYDKKDINFILKGNIMVAFVIGIIIIYRTINGANGKVSVINIFGNMVEENYTAAYISFICLFNLYFLVYGKKKFVSLICFIATFLGVLLTGSRAAFISISIASFILIILQFLFTDALSLRKKLIYILIISLIIGVFIMNLEKILPEFIYNRFFVKSLDDNSNNVRIQIWNYAFNHLSNRPLFGYGIGNFSYYLQAIYLDNSTVVAHNTFLDIMMDTGIIGFFYLMFFLIKNLFNVIKEKIFFIPFIFVWLFTAFIVGGERTYFFWNDITLLIILSKYSENHKIIDIFKF